MSFTLVNPIQLPEIETEQNLGLLSVGTELSVTTINAAVSAAELHLTGHVAATTPKVDVIGGLVEIKDGAHLEQTGAGQAKFRQIGGEVKVSSSATLDAISLLLSGSAELTVSSGSILTTSDAALRDSAANSSIVNITNTDSQWNITSGGEIKIVHGTVNVTDNGAIVGRTVDWIVLGENAPKGSTGVLHVKSGGTVTASLNIGDSNDGTVIVEGTNSQVESGDIYVGNGIGSGGLSIKSGGKVTTSGIEVGADRANTAGTVVVDGAGSQLVNSGWLTIGSQNSTSRPSVEVKGGGTISSGATFIGNQSKLTISTPGQSATLDSVSVLKGGTFTIQNAANVTSNTSSSIYLHFLTFP